ncbi:MAG: DUF1311 domain-containing protein [Gammaproteobacteria bacterium]|nr:DUF1311 domain-containing protein [Gammaproteobacteria bacterium]
MKKIGILLLLYVFIQSPGFAFQNETNGFDGIAWGTDVSDNVREMWSMSASTTDANIITYERKNDKPRVGSLRLPTVTYVYYKERFAYVQFQSEAMPALIKAFNDYFGAGEKLAPELDYYLWHGNTTLIALRCESVRGVCDGKFYSSRYLKELGVTLPHAILFDKKIIDKKARVAYSLCDKGFEKTGRPADAYYAECEALVYKTWEAGLEQLYSEFLGRLGPNCQDKLKQAQAEWKTLRDADFPFSDAVLNSRAGHAQKSAQYRTTYVIARVDYLLNLFYATQYADPFDPRIRECIVFRGPDKPATSTR